MLNLKIVTLKKSITRQRYKIPCEGNIFFQVYEFTNWNIVSAFFFECYIENMNAIAGFEYGQGITG